MAWRETNPMKERVLFIDDHESGLYTMSELCEIYGISRKTGYKWLGRYEEEGVEGLRDRSRAPRSCPHRTAEHVEEKLLAARLLHPRWGPRKLLPYLSRRHPELSLPSESTAGDILRRAGLVVSSRRSRRPRLPTSRPRVEGNAPNDVWTIDFKGEFRMGDRRYCYPLTLVDWYSRYVLACEALPSTGFAGTQPVLESQFRRYGLPRAILSDNGAPFSSPAICGLSRLSVWWIKLGIEPLLIQPGHPEQNPRHERMHRELKADTTRPPAANLAAQQPLFDGFCEDYNVERPHEAIGQRPPAELYEESPRPYPERLPEVEYPGHYEVRRVQRHGELAWRGEHLFVSEVLGGEYVGLEEIDDGIWSLCFGPRLIARFDEREGALREVRTATTKAVNHRPPSGGRDRRENT